MLALFLFMVLGCSANNNRNLQVCLEPGHEKQDYDSVEEVKGHENEFETEKPNEEDEHLMKEAILDVAYYLRRFKFSGHDPRYLAEGETLKQNLFAEFPSPPLRNIHWEVKKNCEPSFVECVKYLQKRVSRTVLPRHLDSLTKTKQNGWSFITDRDLIKSADDECLRLLADDENLCNTFAGTLERFQWLTSASYYMCLYTMKEVGYLKHFADDCDNHGSCIQWVFGVNNKDVRGDNSRPFACAQYSFCPDPCCPLKHLSEWFLCVEASPCLGSDRTCSFSKKENTNLESFILNQWNVSCKCDEPGMRWESKSGMCVDIDECVEKDSACNYPYETCINLPGTYKCTCSPLGYRKNEDTKLCEEDEILQKVFYPTQTSTRNITETMFSSFYGRVEDVVRKVKFVMSVVLKNYNMKINEIEN